MDISAEMKRQILLERERLTFPPLPTQKSTGIGISRFIVSCDSDALAILQLAKTVLLIVINHSIGKWPSLECWKKILPIKFVSSFLPEQTQWERLESQIKWDGLTYEEKLKDAAQDERWTLSGWLSWLEPPLDNTHFLVEVTPLDSPFMSGALKWLFKASGAVNAVLEDDL